MADRKPDTQWRNSSLDNREYGTVSSCNGSDNEWIQALFLEFPRLQGLLKRLMQKRLVIVMMAVEEGTVKEEEEEEEVQVQVEEEEGKEEEEKKEEEKLELEEKEREGAEVTKVVEDEVEKLMSRRECPRRKAHISQAFLVNHYLAW